MKKLNARIAAARMLYVMEKVQQVSKDIYVAIITVSINHFNLSMRKMLTNLG